MGSIRQLNGNVVAHTLKKNVMYYVPHNSMTRIDNGQWLNDEIINDFMKLLEIYSAENTELKVKCQKTAFMDKILQNTNYIDCYYYESVGRCMHEQVEDFDIILYSINITQYHLVLSVV